MVCTSGAFLTCLHGVPCRRSPGQAQVSPQCAAAVLKEVATWLRYQLLQELFDFAKSVRGIDSGCPTIQAVLLALAAVLEIVRACTLLPSMVCNPHLLRRHCANVVTRYDVVSSGMFVRCSADCNLLICTGKLLCLCRFEDRQVSFLVECSICVGVLTPLRSCVVCRCLQRLTPALRQQLCGLMTFASTWNILETR